MDIFNLVLGFSLGISSVIVVFIFKCKCIYADNLTVHKDHTNKGKFSSKERSYKKYVTVKNDHKTLSVNINKIKTQIKSVERNNKKPFQEYKDIIAQIEVLKMYIEEVLKNSADMVLKVQGPPPAPTVPIVQVPPPAPTVPIVQVPPPEPTVPIVQVPPPPPLMVPAGNSVSSCVGSNATPQKTYRCIPITTELLKSVVLKPPGERNIKKRFLPR
ncbi:hypothetical protein QTP88_002864 [Uroleucon formosanum]